MEYSKNFSVKPGSYSKSGGTDYKSVMSVTKNSDN